MMALNHAVTGAIIGLSVDEPAAALPLAFASHFALDAIPHYDPPAPKGLAYLFRSKRFLYEVILLNGGLCLLLVVILAISRPKHWLTAAICAFLATSPDLFWAPRFVSARRTGKDLPLNNRFWRFHDRIQWKTAPRLIWLELAWLAVTGAALWHLI
jgi:hypothetical protein